MKQSPKAVAAANRANELAAVNNQKILSPRVHIFAKEHLENVLSSRGDSGDEDPHLTALLPKSRKIKRDYQEFNNNEDTLLNKSSNNEQTQQSIILLSPPPEGIEFVGDQKFEFNQVQQIKDCKDMRHRAKENFLKECRSHQITKENCSKEKYQLFKIMEKTDKLTRPEENASIRTKLDQLEIKNMLSTLNQLENKNK